jgi:hypothetical protein
MEATRNPEEEAKAMASSRLAYQNLYVQQKQEEECLKKVDPSKDSQIERLGMGFRGEMLNCWCGSGFSDLLRQHRGPDSPRGPGSCLSL